MEVDDNDEQYLTEETPVQEETIPVQEETTTAQEETTTETTT